MKVEYQKEMEERTSPLLRVNWFRIVLDEGHIMGKGKLSNFIQMASCLESERRWVMTGTPTPSFSTSISDQEAEFKHLFHIFKFLKLGQEIPSSFTSSSPPSMCLQMAVGSTPGYTISPWGVLACGGRAEHTGSVQLNKTLA